MQNCSSCKVFWRMVLLRAGAHMGNSLHLHGSEESLASCSLCPPSSMALSGVCEH